MAKTTFVGHSVNGDINLALKDAIDTAKNSLGARIVDWKIMDISGMTGGFVGDYYLSLKIEAEKKS